MKAVEIGKPVGFPRPCGDRPQLADALGEVKKFPPPVRG